MSQMVLSPFLKGLRRNGGVDQIRNGGVDSLWVPWKKELIVSQEIISQKEREWV